MNLSLPAIFGAGLLTFGSPCVLPLIPIYLSVLVGASISDVRSGAQRGRVLATSAAFVVGLTLVFMAMGMAATAVGHALLSHRTLLLRLGGIAVLLFGLKFLGVLRVPWLDREFRPGLDAPGRRGGLLGALVFGAAFGFGWTPCIGPVLGTVLTYTASATADPWMGALYLATYAAGLALPLMVTAAIAPTALAWLRRVQAHVRKVEVVTGVALSLAGVLMITDRLGDLASPFSREPSEAVAAQRPTPPAAATPAAPCDAPDAHGAVTCGMPSQVTGEAAPAPAALAHTPRLVEFVSRECTVCRRMAPVVAAAERVCSHGPAVQRIDVGTPGGRDLARRYGIVGVPTFLGLDANHEERRRLIGEQPQDRLIEALEALSGSRCTSVAATDAAVACAADGSTTGGC